MIRSIFYSVAVSAVLAAVSAPAFASPTFATEALGSTAEQTRVTVGKVDFTDPAQVNALYNRLHMAAKRVCDVPGENDPFVADESRQCEDEAIGNAVRDLDRPGLSAVYEADARRNARAGQVQAGQLQGARAGQ